jgi:hypothetical protein
VATVTADLLIAPSGATRGRFGRGTPANPPPTQTAFVPRYAESLLFQPLDTKLYYNDGWGPYDYELFAPTGGPGPTSLFVDRRAGWRWRWSGGDGVDANGNVMAATAITSHWVQIPANSANNTTYTTNCTAAVQFVQAGNRHNAYRLSHGAAAFRVVATHRHTNAAYRPRMSVVYVGDTAPTDLPCTMVAAVSSGSQPQTFAESYSAPVFLEFARPARAVASATISITVLQHFSGTTPMNLNVLDAPITNDLQGAGVAESLTADVGLKALPGVIYTHDYHDSKPASYWISPNNYNLSDSDFSPEFWGGAVDTNRLPYTELGADGQGKWVNPTTSNTNITVVPSTYTGENFVPIRPGLGALKTVIVGTDQENGYTSGTFGTAASVARLYFPASKLGKFRRMRLRYYFRFHFERPLVASDRKFGGPGFESTFLQHSGKWGPSPDFGTTLGSVSGTSGGGRGGQMRNQWIACIDGTDGPNKNRIVIGTHWKDDYFVPEDAYPADFSELYSDGGYAAGIFTDRWHLFECDFTMNTLTNSGLGRQKDGTQKVWIDKRLVFDRGELIYRTNPVSRGVGVMTHVRAPGNTGNGTLTDLATYNVAGFNSDPNGFRDTIAETLTVVMTSATAFTVTGSFSGANAAGTVGTAYTSMRGHRFRVNAGATPWAAGDTITLTYPPFYTVPSNTISTPTNDFGWHSLWHCVFHGGKTFALIDKTLFISGLAVGDGDQMTGPFGAMGGVTI